MNREQYTDYELKEVSLALRLKQLRLKKSISLQDVATRVGASKTHIWDLETGKAKNPSLDLLKRLADFFQVGIADLVGENPDASDEDSGLVAMYRDLKKLSDNDQQTIKVLINQLKNNYKR